MAEAIADRLAEAFAEYLHKRVRDGWGFGQGEDPNKALLPAVRKRGNRAQENGGEQAQKTGAAI